MRVTTCEVELSVTAPSPYSVKGRGIGYMIRSDSDNLGKQGGPLSSSAPFFPHENRPRRHEEPRFSEGDPSSTKFESGVGPRNTNDGLSSKVLPVPIILGLEPPGAVQALLKAVRETTGGN